MAATRTSKVRRYWKLIDEQRALEHAEADPSEIEPLRAEARALSIELFVLPELAGLNAAVLEETK